MGELPPLQLEQKFSDCSDFSEVTILAELIIRCPGYHVCRSAVFKQDFVTDVELDTGSTTFSILRGKLIKGGRLPMISSSPATFVVQHEGVDVCNFNKIIEVCSGLGVVSTGLPFCNADAACYVDYNEKFVEWLDRKRDTPVILGDIGDPHVVKQVADVTKGHPMPLNGGIACQPFSSLGDRREHADPRSSSLPALLKMGYLLRSPLITLECTKEAHDSIWVQNMLRAFTEQTGYVLHQKVLTLHHTWPAHRTRWWACLSMPMLGIQEIPDMPQMEFCPSIMHLMQIHPHLPPDESSQLSLSAFELRHFHDQPQGISHSVINAAKALPTATHSWGSQLGACHCECRQQGFSLSRILTKGLYGVLIPLGTMVKAGKDWFHGMRHPHPKEVAILNALDPRYLDHSEPFTLKFLLAGVGQMASPLQGAWMYSNLFFQLMKNGFPVSVQPPRHVMGNICRELIEARNITWPHNVHNRSTLLFERELNRLDHPVTSLPPDEVDQYVQIQMTQHAAQEITAHLSGPVAMNHGSEEQANQPIPSFVDQVSTHDTDRFEHDMPSTCELLQVLEPMTVFEDFPVQPPFLVNDVMNKQTDAHVHEDETPCSPDFFVYQHVHLPQDDHTGGSDISEKLNTATPGSRGSCTALASNLDQMTLHASEAGREFVSCSVGDIRQTLEAGSPTFMSTGSLEAGNNRASEAGSCKLHHVHAFEAGSPSDARDFRTTQARVAQTPEAGFPSFALGLASEAGLAFNVHSSHLQSAAKRTAEAGSCGRAFEAGIPSLTHGSASEAGFFPSVHSAHFRREANQAPEAGFCIRASEAGVVSAASGSVLESESAPDVHSDHIRRESSCASEAGSNIRAPVAVVPCHMLGPLPEKCTTDVHTLSLHKPAEGAAEVGFRHMHASNASDHTVVQSIPALSLPVEANKASLAQGMTSHMPMQPGAADDRSADAYAQRNAKRQTTCTDIPAGSARLMHAQVFAPRKTNDQPPVPMQEVMTTKPDPLLANDPWLAAKSNERDTHEGLNPKDHSSPGAPAYGTHGGMMHFANRKRVAESDAAPDAKRHAQLSCPQVSLTKEHDEAEKQPATAMPELPQTNPAWVGHPQQPLHKVHCLPGTTIGQLATAESKLVDLPTPVQTLSAVGSHVPVYTKVKPQQIILLRDGRVDQPKTAPNLQGCTRLDALWQQLGWVAQDEMAFYLSMLGQPNLPNTTEPIMIDSNEDAPQKFDEWIASAIEASQSNGRKFSVHTACWFDSHWFPLSLRIDGDDIHITTTHTAVAQVQQWAVEALGNVFQFHYKVAKDAFPADCGFQSIAWIMAQELDETQAYPMPVEDAIKWRELFAHHLVNNNNAQDPVAELRLGGMLESHNTELSTLLQQHGVKPDRVPSVIAQLNQTLGPTSLKQTLGSARPWADLKTKASALQPPIKLVLTEELQAQIAARLSTGKPIGGRKNKQHKKPAQSKWMAPQASQVQIPDGIFQQQDGTPLGQITLHQMQMNQRGIAVVNIQDAAPFFHLTKALSAEGVGMLVLDFQDESLPQHHQVVRFPASCPETQEPMILTAALLQLGQQQVSRVLPQQPTAIDQVDTKVVRAVLYRDQTTIPWPSLQNKPVKAILDLEHFASLNKGDLLDVWDRQFLSKNYQKMKPEEADMFSVVLRLQAESADNLMQFNSKDGLYLEPRTQSGHDPCPTCRVVWLPKKTFHDTMIAKQATEHHTHIARSGDRFGLRTSTAHAAEVHKQHRPEVAYLDGTATKMFKIAPLPFGSTKQSIQKVFDTWGWQARPSHTQGLTADRQGLIWIAHATEQPQYYIFTMEHGDVLISEVQSSKPQAASNEGAPVASVRTLRHLAASSANVQQLDQGQADPLQVNDPWANARKQQAPKHAGPSPGQLASIEHNIEKRILAAIQDKEGHTQKEDDPMDAQTSQRMAQLESQVSALTDNLTQLSGSMTTFKQQQHAHNTQVAHQVQALKSQADQQEHTMKSLLEAKLEEQMSKIEALFTNKRPKTNE